MKIWKRALAFFLSMIMVFGVLPAAGITESPIQRAEAGSAGSDFTAEEFGRCYSAVLLNQVGKGYRGGAGYAVNGTSYNAQGSRVTAGTPYNPTTVTSTMFDCHSLAITALMAMGYDYFTDGTRTWPLNAYYGGGPFGEGARTDSILYTHKTGDIITLHHSNDQKYTIKFKLGEVVDKADVTDVLPGTLLFTLDNDSYYNKKLTPGPFGVGDLRKVNHTAVALFYKRALASDSHTGGGQASWANDNQSAAKDILEASWNDAYKYLITNDVNKISSTYTKIYGTSLSAKISGGSYRNTSADESNQYWTPYMFDARGRGFSSVNTGDPGYKRGFRDGHATFHFNTEYSPIWQIEALNPQLGVSVNNNPFGKSSFQMTVELIPLHQYGSVEITKNGSDGASNLTGAKFDLYEWSVSQNKYVISSGWEVKDPDNNGVYNTYAKGTNTQDKIEITGENLGKIKVVETTAPTGYVANFSEEHQFTGDNETISWAVTAVNPAVGNLQIVKSMPAAPGTARTFWFRITGPSGFTTTWRSITISASGTSNSVTLSNIPLGSYTVTEVTGDGSTTPVSRSSSFPFDTSYSPTNGTVTVSKGATSTVNITNEDVRTGGLKIVKSMSAAPGTEKVFWFYITGPNSYAKWESITISASGTTNSVTLTGLYPGSYTVKEVTGNNSTTAVSTSASFPYIATPNPAGGVVTVNKNTGSNPAAVTWTNAPAYGSLTITKKLNKADSKDRTFWFYVQQTSGGTYTGWTSITITKGGTSNTATLNNLNPGNYKVTEVTGNGSTTEISPTEALPYSVTYDPSSQVVAVAAGGNGSISVTNTKAEGEIKIVKSMPSAPGEDRTFWFRITGPDGYESWKSISITASGTMNSVTISGLAVGSYTVTEVTGNNSTTAVSATEAFPYDATVSPANGKVTVTKGTQSTVTWTNTKVVGSLKIVKTVSAAPGTAREFWFYVTGPANYKAWKSITIAANGTTNSIQIDNLQIGTYVVTEVTGNNSTTPASYSSAFPYVASGSGDVSVTRGAVATKEITNKEVGRLTVTKSIDKAPTTAKTFYIWVKKDDGTYQSWQALTVAAGSKTQSVTINDLATGSYTVTEVTGNNSTTPVSYSSTFPYVSSGNGAVTVTAGQTASKTITNTEVGELEIRKTIDKAPSAAKTFWFHVTGANGYDSYVSITVPASGTTNTALLSNLNTGAYVVTEVKASGDPTPVSPENAFPYRVNGTNGVNATVAPGQKVTVEVKNEELGNLSITKRLRIPAATDTTFWFKITGPSNFTTTWVSVTVPADGVSETATLSWIPTGSYTITEVTDNNSDTAVTTGTSFHYTTNGAVTATVTAGQTAAATIDNLEVGNLSIHKDGYVPKYTFDGDKLLTAADLSTTKASLAGAVFELYAAEDFTYDGTFLIYNGVELQNGALVATLTTDASGNASLENLPAGKYKLVEVSAPAHYIVDPAETTIEVTMAGVTKDFVNNLESLSIEVVKAEDSGTKVKDALIGLFTTEVLSGDDVARNTVDVGGVTYSLLAVAKTDADGIASFDYPLWDADRAKLVIIEIEAPDGYERNPDVFPVSAGTITNPIAGQTKSTVDIKETPINIMGTRATVHDDDTIQQQAAVSKDTTITLMDNVYFSQNPSTTDWRLFIAGYNLPAEARDLKVVGKLVDTKTGDVLKDKNGDEIIGETLVTASSVETLIDSLTGDTYFRVRVKFENVDTSDLAGKTIVMFEYVYLGNGLGEYSLVSEDTNIANLAETVYFPSIGTTFVNLQCPGNTPGISGEKTPFEDTCHVENIIVGQNYRLDAKLWDKTAGEFIKVGGNEVLGTLSFTAAATTEDRVVAFTISTLGLEDHDLVCYEYLYLIEGSNETLIVSEENPDDVKQTKSVTRIQLPSTGRRDVQMWYFMAILLMLLGLAWGTVGVIYRKSRKEVA